jgi:dissimilatory sulfite reductase (desulfoviridin) alpha/beta subunit
MKMNVYTYQLRVTSNWFFSLFVMFTAVCFCENYSYGFIHYTSQNRLPSISRTLRNTNVERKEPNATNSNLISLFLVTALFGIII